MSALTALEPGTTVLVQPLATRAQSDPRWAGVQSAVVLSAPDERHYIVQTVTGQTARVLWSNVSTAPLTTPAVTTVRDITSGRLPAPSMVEADRVKFLLEALVSTVIQNHSVSEESIRDSVTPSVVLDVVRLVRALDSAAAEPIPAQTDRDNAPSVAVYWYAGGTDEDGEPDEGYYVAQVDTVNDETPMRVYVNDGVVYTS